MASDEELARRVAQLEGTPTGRVSDGPATREELEEYREIAREIHDELPRQIAGVGDESADSEDLSTVIDRLDRLEARLDDLESRL